MSHTHAMIIVFAAIFTNNILLSNFLGMCSFLACSQQLGTALGLGAAVTFGVIGAVPGVILGSYFGVLMAQAIDEALRVVAPTGMIEIWTFAPESMVSSALGRWFPSVVELDSERFPAIDALSECLERTGAAVEVDHLPEIVERTAASWQAAVRNRFVSTIQLLTDAEIEEGLDRFTEVYGTGDKPYLYTVDFVRLRATW